MERSFRAFFLRLAYRWFPFSLKGNACIPEKVDLLVSCVIPTCAHGQELEKLLGCLKDQDLSKDLFEVIIVSDGEDVPAEQLCRDFGDQLNVLHLTSPLSHNIGALRNRGVESSRGKVVLFLDDDTVLADRGFLRKLSDAFDEQDADVLLPKGRALSVPGRQDGWIDEYSFAMRCCAYSRRALIDLGGMVSGIQAYTYEDIDLGIRALLQQKRIIQASFLEYFHPPVFFSSLRKPLAIGYSLLQFRKFYSTGFWWIAFLNAIRYLPFLLWPWGPAHQLGRLSTGIFLAVIFPEKGRTGRYGE